MYDNIARNRGVVRENCAISLKRAEWQQPANAIPPLNKRLAGQRRRRLLGSFPETQNDVSGPAGSSMRLSLLVFLRGGNRRSAGVFCLSKPSRPMVGRKR